MPVPEHGSGANEPPASTMAAVNPVGCASPGWHLATHRSSYFFFDLGLALGLDDSFTVVFGFLETVD